MTPVGHVAIGFVLGHPQRSWRRWAPWVCAIGAAFPDVDFVLVWSPHFNAWHRVVTHNLVFVIASALVLTWPLAHRFAAPRIGVAAMLVLGGLSHLLVDACLDANASNGIGVALWWPFDATMVSPVNLVEPGGDPRGWGDPRSALRAAAGGLAWELPWIAVALLLLLRRRRSSATPGAR